jgi:light-harvesting complex 1 beta chain
MTMANNVQRVPAREMQETHSVSFLTLFTVSFVVFAAIAVVGQMLGWHWRSWLPGAEGVKSMTGGVKAAVYTFMSHLH